MNGFYSSVNEYRFFRLEYNMSGDVHFVVKYVSTDSTSVDFRFNFFSIYI
jgi:hypothetical protein